MSSASESTDAKYVGVSLVSDHAFDVTGSRAGSPMSLSGANTRALYRTGAAAVSASKVRAGPPPRNAGGYTGARTATVTQSARADPLTLNPMTVPPMANFAYVCSGKYFA